MTRSTAPTHAEPSATETWDTYHPGRAAPIVPPARPQQPWDPDDVARDALDAALRRV